MRQLLCASILALAAAAAVANAAAAPVVVDRWQVPWKNSRPRDPAVAADGRIWFCGQTGDYLARFDPKTGAFERFPLETGAGPHNLILDPAGRVWYAGNTAAHIGMLDPADGPGIEHLTKFPMPDAAARDPHTLIADGRGSIWFTLQQSNMIGRLDMTSGKIRLVQVPTPKARPYGIALDAQGRPWVNLLGSNRLATVDPKSFALREVVLPRADARTRRIAISADGAVWYADYGGGHVGRYDPARGAFEEWLMPGGADARPYAMALDDRGRLWIAQSGDQPNTLVSFNTVQRRFGAPLVIAEAHGAIRHMVFDAGRRELWFGTDTDGLVRVRLTD